MRVAALQFDVARGDVDANLETVAAGLAEARAAGVELVLLPEMWTTSFVADTRDAGLLAASDRALERVAALTAELDLAVAGSALGAGPTAELPRNRLTLVDRGVELMSYDKLHLFSPTAEPMAFGAGASPPETVESRGWRVSGVVCYDLRFASALRAPFVDEAELLLVPAQWPEPRATHWRALVIGRAVEHQAFVLAANRTGRDEIGRRRLELAFPGNSLVVSPHGVVLGEGAGQSGLVVADLDLDELRALRRRVPVRADERGPGKN